MKRLLPLLVLSLTTTGCKDQSKDQLKAQIADLQSEVTNLQGQLDAKANPANAAGSADIDNQLSAAAQVSVLTGSALGAMPGDPAGLDDPSSPAPSSGDTTPGSSDPSPQ